MEITVNTTMGEMLEYDMGIAYVLMQCGMHCVGCPSSIGESLEEACAALPEGEVRACGVNAGGKLTGYAGGIDRKEKLLALEKAGRALRERDTEGRGAGNAAPGVRPPEAAPRLIFRPRRSILPSSPNTSGKERHGESADIRFGRDGLPGRARETGPEEGLWLDRHRGERQEGLAGDRLI